MPSRRWMQNLATKIAFLSLGAVMLTAAAMVVLAVWLSGQYNTLAQGEVDRLIRADLDHITQGVYNLLSTQNEAVQQQLAGVLQGAQYLIREAGGMRLSRDTIEWSVPDQSTSQPVRVALPRAFIGDRWIAPNTDPAVPSAVVDEVARFGGGTATIFQRTNARGGMVRIATTVIDERGRRAIGACFPLLESGGVSNPLVPRGLSVYPNPAVSTILEGRNFQGKVFDLGEWYLFSSEPIRDVGGEIVGMLGVGFSMKSVKARLEKAIVGTVVGKTGYVFVLGGGGSERGRYIISQRGERDGENIWDSRDSDGNYMIRDIIAKALELGPGEMATHRYRWQNPQDAEPRWKIARLAYFAPWDWVIGTSANEDELEEYRAVLEQGRTRMTMAMLTSGLSISFLFIVFAILFAMTIVKPIRRMTLVAERIAQGDLDQRVEAPSGGEIGTLARSFNLMSDRLRQTLDSLRRSELEYRGIFESATEGLFRATVEGSLVSANPAMASIFGYDSPEDLIGSITDLGTQLYVHPEDQDALIAYLREHGEVEDRESLMRRRDGTEIWVSISEQLVRAEASGQEILQGFLVDITERKRDEERRRKLEEHLRQAQKMETIGLLAGGVAHDFNNLLTPILGYAELLMDGGVPEPSRIEQLNEIQMAAERARDLTQQLLAFGRKQMIDLKPVDLGALIRRFEGILRRAIRENVSIVISVCPELDAVRADPGQIEQVLLNLCVNAQDAMPGGGTLEIAAANVTLDEAFASQHPDSLPGPYVMLTVRDTGAGMDARTIEHLFEPFFTTKEMGRGTGLGLSTVYGIIQQHGGFIEVASAPGRGSTFKVYLPRGQAEQPASGPAGPAQSPRQGGETILVAEDDAMVRALASGMLERLGYLVLTAESARRGLDIADAFQGAIDLLLTDVVMPDINGSELYRLLKERRPGLKALFMSGYPGETLARDIMPETGVDVLQKPFTLQALSEKVRQVIDGAA